MLTMDLKSILISVLLIALIVLTIYLIVLANKLIYTVKNINVVVDESEKVVAGVRDTVNSKVASAREKKAAVQGLLGNGISIATSIASKIKK